MRLAPFLSAIAGSLIVCGQAVPAPQTAEVCINKFCVTAEVVDTDETRARGLMSRSSLSEGQGMLFVFPQPGEYGFWMKNMLIPIDIVWMDKDKKVLDMRTNAQPCGKDCESMMPSGPSLYVIELKAGFIDRHNIRIGDEVFFSLSDR
ncbi:MAG: DUF192 domain-containing protein [Candidatus Omnitrophica bacterium]|nr:DUF192 domain-containing protein [Candidatus Omnitrophota bacterium]